MLSVSFLLEYSDAEFGHSRKITNWQIELEILEKWKTKFLLASTFSVFQLWDNYRSKSILQLIWKWSIQYWLIFCCSMGLRRYLSDEIPFRRRKLHTHPEILSEGGSALGKEVCCHGKDPSGGANSINVDYFTKIRNWQQTFVKWL